MDNSDAHDQMDARTEDEGHQIHVSTSSSRISVSRLNPQHRKDIFYSPFGSSNPTLVGSPFGSFNPTFVGSPFGSSKATFVGTTFAGHDSQIVGSFSCQFGVS